MDVLTTNFAQLRCVAICFYILGLAFELFSRRAYYILHHPLDLPEHRTLSKIDANLKLLSPGLSLFDSAPHLLSDLSVFL